MAKKEYKIPFNEDGKQLSFYTDAETVMMDEETNLKDYLISLGGLIDDKADKGGTGSGSGSDDDISKAVEDAINKAIGDAITRVDALIEYGNLQINAYNENAAKFREELEKLKNEAKIAAEYANTKAAEAAALLGNPGEIVKQFIESEDGWKSFVGMKVDEDGGKDFSWLVQTTKGLDSFVGNMKTENSSLSEYLNTRFQQTSDKIKLEAAKLNYEPYNGVDARIALGSPITLDPNIDYYFICSSSDSVLKYVNSTTGESEEFKQEASILGSAVTAEDPTLTIYLVSGPTPQEACLYKTLQSSYSTIEVTPEQIRAAILGEEGSFSELILTDDEIQAIAAKVAGEYVTSGELAIATDKIKAEVGETLHETVETIELNSEGKYTVNILTKGKYQLLGLNKLVNYSVGGAYALYDNYVVFEAEANQVLSLERVSEDVALRGDYKLVRILETSVGNIEIAANQVLTTVNNYSEDGTLKGAVEKVSVDAIESAVFESSENGEVKFSDVIQTVGEIDSIVYDGEKGASALIQKVDTIALGVQSGICGNLLSGLVDLEGWNLPPIIITGSQDSEHCVDINNPKLEVLTGGGFVVKWPHTEALGLSTIVTSPEIELEKDKYYVLSFGGANKNCLANISFKYDSKKYLITNLANEWFNITHNTYEEGEDAYVIFKSTYDTIAKLNNLVFKAPISGTIKLFLNIVINDLDAYPYNYVNFQKIKLELGANELNSQHTAWTLNTLDTYKASRLAVTDSEIVSTVFNATDSLRSEIRLTNASIETKVKNGLSETGLTITDGKNTFTGDVIAKNFMVSDPDTEDAGILYMTLWNKDFKEKFSNAPTIKYGVPVLVAEYEDNIYILNMTLLTLASGQNMWSWVGISPTFKQETLVYYYDSKSTLLSEKECYELTEGPGLKLNLGTISKNESYLNVGELINTYYDGKNYSCKVDETTVLDITTFTSTAAESPSLSEFEITSTEITGNYFIYNETFHAPTVGGLGHWTFITVLTPVSFDSGIKTEDSSKKYFMSAINGHNYMCSFLPEYIELAKNADEKKKFQEYMHNVIIPYGESMELYGGTSCDIKGFLTNTEYLEYKLLMDKYNNF